MNRKHLFPLIHNKTRGTMNRYIKSRAVDENISEYIVPPRLKNDSGILGALSMAVYETESRA